MRVFATMWPLIAARLNVYIVCLCRDAVFERHMAGVV